MRSTFHHASIRIHQNQVATCPVISSKLPLGFRSGPMVHILTRFSGSSHNIWCYIVVIPYASHCMLHCYLVLDSNILQPRHGKILTPIGPILIWCFRRAYPCIMGLGFSPWTVLRRCAMAKLVRLARAASNASDNRTLFNPCLVQGWDFRSNIWEYLNDYQWFIVLNNAV